MTLLFWAGGAREAVSGGAEEWRTFWGADRGNGDAVQPDAVRFQGYERLFGGQSMLLL